MRSTQYHIRIITCTTFAKECVVPVEVITLSGVWLSGYLLRSVHLAPYIHDDDDEYFKIAFNEAYVIIWAIPHQ